MTNIELLKQAETNFIRVSQNRMASQISGLKEALGSMNDVAKILREHEVKLTNGQVLTNLKIKINGEEVPLELISSIPVEIPLEDDK